MQYSVGCSLRYEVQAPTPFLFNVEAARFHGQQVRHEKLKITPEIPIERWTMPESGNRYLRIVAPPGKFELRYEAEVSLAPEIADPKEVTEMPIERLPLTVFTHLYPSRYCQSDKLERFAHATFQDLPAGYRRVNGICNWIYDQVEYVSGASDALTSAFDTVTQRQGVCRDFAHLAIALCRALGIPARYVSAYASLLDPPDFHAVLEAYLDGPDGGAWYLFDPTRKAAPDGLVRIGLGRDAAEVAFSSPFGELHAEKPEVWIHAHATPRETLTTEAISAGR